MATQADNRYLYDQVFELVREQIQSGSLRAGDRLPSLRRMSRQLKVSIATVMQGYTNLEREGYIRAKAQSGFFVLPAPGRPVALPSATTPKPVARDINVSTLVREMLGKSKRTAMASMGVANPGQELLPARTLGRLMHRVVNRNPEQAAEYSDPAGNAELRRQIAYRSSVVGTSVDPESIIVTNGASEALALSLKSVTRTGDTVAVESPTYFLILQLIEDLGLKAIEVPSDPVTGLDIDSFESMLDNFDISCLVCIANFNNPYGSLMPDSHKQRLVDLANARGVRLIEDDIYGDIHFGPHRPRPLKSFDGRGNVVCCSSFSKTLAPGFRIGWIVADEDREQMLHRKYAVSMSSCSVTQLTIAEYLANGGYDRHLAKLRRSLMQQVEKMRQRLGAELPVGTRISHPQGGFVLWVELPRGIDAFELFTKALEQNVSVIPGMIFSPTRKYRNCIRISCGQPWTEEMGAGISVLAKLADELLAARQ